MKYRLLSDTELNELQKEFIEFLVTNSITGPDWEKIKQDDVAKAQQLIALFSDIVFEKVLAKTNYLEHRSAHDLKVFYCGENRIVLIGLSVDPSAGINFLELDNLGAAIAEHAEAFQTYSSQKQYQPDRNSELFKMLENGCSIADEQLFKALGQLKAAHHK